MQLQHIATKEHTQAQQQHIFSNLDKSFQGVHNGNGEWETFAGKAFSYK